MSENMPDSILLQAAATIEHLTERVAELDDQIDRWEQVWTALNDMGAQLGNANKPLAVASSWAIMQHWVNDLQSGMYINCVYCGHRYGPNSEVPATMADVLKEHIVQCPQHPLSHATARIESLEAALRECDPGPSPCECTTLTDFGTERIWMYSCTCGYNDNRAEAAAWCRAKNRYDRARRALNGDDAAEEDR